MQKVVIAGRKVEYIEMTPKEEQERLQEIEESSREFARQQKRVAKKQLLQSLLDLREMRQNRGIFTQDDIDDKQIEVNRLKDELE